MEIFKYAIIGVLGVIVVYSLLRLTTFAITKSVFQVIIKHKEDCEDEERKRQRKG